MDKTTKIHRLINLIKENETGTKMYSEIEMTEDSKSDVDEIINMLKDKIDSTLKEVMNEEYDHTKQEELSKEIDEELEKFKKILQSIMSKAKLVKPEKEKKEEDIDLDDLD